MANKRRYLGKWAGILHDEYTDEELNEECYRKQKTSIPMSDNIKFGTINKPISTKYKHKSIYDYD